MIQISRFEGFVQVARAQGYARAARAFPYPITQPGVHQQVKRLEEEVGVRLFERVGKDRVLLTPEGQQLYDYVAPFLEGLPEVVARLRGGKIAGTLRIHASGHVLRHLLPPWLRRLQAKHPALALELHEAKAPALAQLRAGEADLVVDHLPTIPADVEVQVVGVTRPFLVLPRRHPLAKRARLALADLAADPFIAYSADAHLRAMQLQALEAAGVVPPRLLQADASESILGFVAAGLGYSLLASLLPGGPKQDGVLARRLPGPKAGFAIHAAWRRSAAESPLLRAALALAPAARRKEAPGD